MKASRNLWPLGLILTFALFISGTAGLVVLACSQKVDLVSPDYYEQEIRFQSHLDSLDRTRQLGASVIYDQTARRIRICLPRQQAGQPISGVIRLYRPSAAGLDREIVLQPDSNGVHSLEAAGLRSGLWRVRVNWRIQDQDYALDQTLVL